MGKFILAIALLVSAPAFANTYCQDYGEYTVCEDDDTNKQFTCWKYGDQTICEE